MANIICKSWKGVKVEIMKKYYWNWCLKPSQGFGPQIQPQLTRWQNPLIKYPDPDTKEESKNQEQCSPREETNENSKSRPDTDTIEHQQNNAISPHFKTITYGRNRFGTYELSSSDESLMDILIHGRNDSANISYPISPIETKGKQNENISAFSGGCVNSTPGEFEKSTLIL